VQARSVYISSSPADTAFRDALAAALHRVGVNAIYNDLERPANTTRPLDEALLRRCDTCAILLSRAALGAPRVLNETKRFAELAQQETGRTLLVVLLEPIGASELWPFLQDAARVEGPQDAPWTLDALLVGALQALNLPYITSAEDGSLTGRGTAFARRTLPPRTTRPVWPSGDLTTALVPRPTTMEVMRWPTVDGAPGRRRRKAPFSVLVVVAVVFVLVLSGVVTLLHVGGLGGATAARATATSVPTAVPSDTTVPTLVPTATATATATATRVPTATSVPMATATPLPTNWAAFVKTDTTTQGSWMGKYGAQGAYVFEDASNLPATIVVTPNGNLDCGGNSGNGCWAPTTSEPRALEKLSDPTNHDDRIAACWYTQSSEPGSTYSIDVKISDGQTHQMALYILDWDSLGRSETITIYDGSSSAGRVFDTRDVTSFEQGIYLVWKVRGHLLIQVTNGANSANGVVSGIFFAAA
jgi:hypothetical protein